MSITQTIGEEHPKEPTHVDDWVTRCFPRPTPEEAYAAWVLMHMRLPAVMKSKFAAFMEPHKLYCTYEKQRWRVTGASRMGDVWLKNLAGTEPNAFYDLRICIDDCSEWSPVSEEAQ